MTPSIWSYSEGDGTAAEMATAALGLAAASGGSAVAVDFGRLRAGSPGTTPRLVIKGPDPTSPPDVLAEALFRAARQLSPQVILVGGTRNGTEVAARLAAKLKTGCVSGITAVSVEGDRLVGDRSAFSGKVVAKVACRLPAVATVKLGIFPRSEGEPASTSEFDAGEIQARLKVLGSTPREAAAVDLRAAKVIVSAGRGVKKKEDLVALEELARAMGGALGCSRPLSSDLGWLPEEHHIGLTGVTVKPDLYLALGISGQLQHVAGMKDSKVVVAVNTDKDAPIFQASDYGIVGDLYQFVPAFRAALGK